MAGAVDWSLAERVARATAQEGDRPATAAERARLEEALRLAEHWLDAGTLPAPPDAGRTLVLDRDGWIDLAVPALMRLIAPIAAASTEALVTLAASQLEELGRMLGEGPDALDDVLGDGAEGNGLAALGLDRLDIDALDLRALGLDETQAAAMREQLRELLAGGGAGLADLLRGALGGAGGLGGLGGPGGSGSAPDPGALLRPAAATLNALQAGRVIGTLARQVHGHHDLGVPTADGSIAALVAVNVADTFEGYGLDATEVAVVLAVTESAHRRLHHAVGWLDDHVRGLVARFAAAMTVDESQLRDLAEQVQHELDPDDPEAFQRAIERAGRLRLEPNAAQHRILDQLQAVVGVVGAWARHEARVTLAGRLPGLIRIEEVLRRRRAVHGDGEAALAGLLGLDLKPSDETVPERFVATVLDVLGSEGLRGGVAHPKNLPDADELADPGRWLTRNVDEVDVPDDVAGLLAGLGEAPREASAAERAESEPGPGSESGSDGRNDGGPDGRPDGTS
jgi:putative hydrolase